MEIFKDVFWKGKGGKSTGGNAVRQKIVRSNRGLACSLEKATYQSQSPAYAMATGRTRLPEHGKEVLEHIVVSIVFE
ncbi:MAG: hypothetical protein K5657_02605 [Desulfovibrio sp.]|nr:hypothetical protein [Desulfovibrio sp.]